MKNWSTANSHYLFRNLGAAGGFSLPALCDCPNKTSGDEFHLAQRSLAVWSAKFPCDATRARTQTSLNQPGAIIYAV